MLALARILIVVYDDAASEVDAANVRAVDIVAVPNALLLEPLDIRLLAELRVPISPRACFDLLFDGAEIALLAVIARSALALLFFSTFLILTAAPALVIRRLLVAAVQY